MPKPTVSRRTQRERTDTTVEALLAAAFPQFGDQGFAAASLDEICRAAGVTKGALYHHFPGGKPELFEAVALAALERMVDALKKAAARGAGKPDALAKTIDAYFEVALEERVQRIMLQDAPSVFGFQRWRETEYRYSWRFIRDSLDAIGGKRALSEAAKDMRATVIFGACCEATLAIATAKKPRAARAEAVTQITSLCIALAQA